MSKELEIYKVAKGEIVFNVDAQQETLWATQEQIAQLFDVKVPAIAKHLSNIYKSGELQMDATFSKMEKVQIEGGRKVKRHIKLYSLDAIISVGYRVNSKKATDFRIWATKVLHRYTVDGIAINRPRLRELDSKKLQEIESALGLVKRLVASSELSASEAGGILEVITKYAPSFKALQEFDEGHISFTKGKKSTKTLTPSECDSIISQLKKNVKGDVIAQHLRNKYCKQKGSPLNCRYKAK